MPLNKRRTQIAIKAGTEGTYSSSVEDAAYAKTKVFSVNINYDVDQFERNPFRSTIGALASVAGKRIAKLTFSTELAGSGTAGTAPAYGPAILACGFSETVAASTSVTYKPISTSIPVVDIAVYKDGIIHKLHSCVGTFRITAKLGEPVMIEFEFWGVPNSIPVDGANLASVAYDTTIAPSFKGVTASLFSATPQCYTNFDFDLGNTLSPRLCAEDSQGFNSVRITGRKATGRIDPEGATVATFDPWTKLFDGTTGALSLAIGATAGNIATLTSSRVQIVGISDGERDQIQVDELNLRFCEPEYDGSGNYEEFQIALT